MIEVQEAELKGDEIVPLNLELNKIVKMEEGIYFQIIVQWYF